MADRDPQRIRDELVRLAEAQRVADEMQGTTTRRMREVLRQAQEHPDITMVEAAKLIGLSRAGAYKLLEEDSQ